MVSSGFKPEAQTGFAAADAYDAHRPSFTSEAVEELLKHLEVSGVKRAKVADLAAGTGKFTEILSARRENFEIVAIEPHDAMRQQLAQKNLRGVTVVEGAAEDLSELGDGTFAALVVAQSFHWFANMSALKEIARVLQPTGVLGMIWNIEDYNAPKSWDIHQGWENKMRDLIWTFDDGLPRFRHLKWKQVFDEQNSGNPLTLHFADPVFGLPIGEKTVAFETWLTKDDTWKRFRTLSQIAILEGDELDKVKEEFFDAINAEDTVVDEHGRVPVHGKTLFAWASRVPGEPMKSGG